MEWTEILSRLSEAGAVRALASVGLVARGGLYAACGRQYDSMNDICRAVRVSRGGTARQEALRAVRRLLLRVGRSRTNLLVPSFLASPTATKRAQLYAVSGHGVHDLYRDLIVLKGRCPTEKGVILLKYARTFDAVVALFDMHLLMERYIFVLEPCWAGYCDPSVLMFVTPGHPVFVQCFTPEDFEFISWVGHPLVPLRLGPADWVDADVFSRVSATSKAYDLVMVANWAPHKRHAVLFRALERMRGRRLTVLLAGFPWHGRSAADILREARAALATGNVQLDIRESVPQTELASLVARSKVFVFLSRKEGDNKALVEAMFAGVPAIVYSDTVGGAKTRINSATGILAGDEELPEQIEFMLDHYEEFSPRAWALSNTGSGIATRVLGEAIRQSTLAAGGPWTRGIVEKTNAPNLAYKDPSMRDVFAADYSFIGSCLRAVVRSAASPPWKLTVS